MAEDGSLRIDFVDPAHDAGPEEDLVEEFGVQVSGYQVVCGGGVEGPCLCCGGIAGCDFEVVSVDDGV